MTNSISEIEEADCIFIIGSNTTEAHPLIGWRVRQAVDKGSRLIVADPRRTDVAEMADIHLKLQPGTDIPLLNAMMKIILDEDLADMDFVGGRTENFDGLKETVKKYDIPDAASQAGVEPSDIKEAARMYATAERSSILYTLGITEHICGTDNVLSIANLAMLTGNVGKESTGVNPLRGQNNVQGACDMAALPAYLPGYQKYTDDETKKEFEKNWEVELSDTPGYTLSEMFPAAIEGNLKAVFEMGEDPVMSDPNQKHIIEAFKSLDFLMVQDIFMSETAKFADVVLPAACFAEKNGTFTNSERRVQRVRKALEPPEGTKPDWEIICELADRMGYSRMNYSDPSEIMDEIASLTPIYGGMSFERIEDTGLQWPCEDYEDSGTKFLHEDTFSRGKGKFHSIDHTDPAEMTNRRYPLILSTGRILFQYNAGSMSRRTTTLDREDPENFVQIHPDDARELDIENEQVVDVVTRRGRVQAKARVTTAVKEGVIWMPFHFVENPANALTIDEYDPEAKTAEYKVCAAKIEERQ